MELAANRPATALKAHVLDLAAGGAGPAELRDWVRGVVGEVEVAEELMLLPPGFRVLHSVPLGPGTADLDHLIIGPTGVFAVNTKHYCRASIAQRGPLLYRAGITAGSDELGRAAAAARRAEASLSRHGRAVRVRPVVALHHATLDRGHTAGRSEVVTTAELVPLLCSGPTVLSPAEVDRLHRVASSRSTWDGRGAVAGVDEAAYARVAAAVSGCDRRPRRETVQPSVPTVVARREPVAVDTVGVVLVYALAALGLVTSGVTSLVGVAVATARLHGQRSRSLVPSPELNRARSVAAIVTAAVVALLVLYAVV